MTTIAGPRTLATGCLLFFPGVRESLIDLRRIDIFDKRTRERESESQKANDHMDHMNYRIDVQLYAGCFTHNEFLKRGVGVVRAIAAVPANSPAAKA